MASERAKDMLERILGYEDTFIDYILDPIHWQVGLTKIMNNYPSTSYC